MFAVDGPDTVILYTARSRVLLPAFGTNAHALREWLWIHILMWSRGYLRKDREERPEEGQRPSRATQ